MTLEIKLIGMFRGGQTRDDDSVQALFNSTEPKQLLGSSGLTRMTGPLIYFEL